MASNKGFVDKRGLSKNIIELIHNHIKMELRRLYGLKRIYNPFTLRIVHRIDYSDLGYIIRSFIRYAVDYYGRDGVCKGEAKNVLREIGFLEIISRKGIGCSGYKGSVFSEILNDFRRLGVVRLAIVDNIVYRLPVIYPTWRDSIKVGKYKLRIYGLFSKRLLDVSESGFLDSLFLSFFEGNPLTNILVSIYRRYGVIDLDKEEFVKMLLYEIVSMYRKVIGSEVFDLYSFIEDIYRSTSVFKKALATLEYVFGMKGVNIIDRDRVRIDNSVVEYIIDKLNIKIISYNQYMTALKRAWDRYWRGVKPWYASLEELYQLVNRELSTLLNEEVSLSLEEHIRYVSELARWGRVEYWVGGLDPRNRHWVRVS